MKTTTIHPTVAAAIALDELSDQWHITLSPERSLEFLAAKEEDYLVELLTNINGVVPVMSYGANNPNNGNMHHNYIIGKEYYRTVYVYIVKAYMKTFNPQQWKILVATIHMHADEAECDEFHITETEDSLKIRMWFDKR